MILLLLLSVFVVVAVIALVEALCIRMAGGFVVVTPLVLVFDVCFVFVFELFLSRLIVIILTTEEAASMLAFTLSLALLILY